MQQKWGDCKCAESASKRKRNEQEQSWDMKHKYSLEEVNAIAVGHLFQQPQENDELDDIRLSKRHQSQVMADEFVQLQVAHSLPVQGTAAVPFKPSAYANLRPMSTRNYSMSPTCSTSVSCQSQLNITADTTGNCSAFRISSDFANQQQASAQKMSTTVPTQSPISKLPPGLLRSLSTVHQFSDDQRIIQPTPPKTELLRTTSQDRYQGHKQMEFRKAVVLRNQLRQDQSMSCSSEGGSPRSQRSDTCSPTSQRSTPLNVQTNSSKVDFTLDDEVLMKLQQLAFKQKSNCGHRPTSSL